MAGGRCQMEKLGFKGTGGGRRKGDGTGEDGRGLIQSGWEVQMSDAPMLCVGGNSPNLTIMDLMEGKVALTAGSDTEPHPHGPSLTSPSSPSITPSLPAFHTISPCPPP